MAGVDPNSVKIQICLLGHSFIRRLSEFMDSNPDFKDLNLDAENYEITVCAKGGLRTGGLQCMLKGITGHPDIHFIQIGGNDIGYLSNEKIVINILSFSEYLTQGLDSKRVIIGQLLRRDPSVSVAGYNDSVVEINSLLTQKTQAHERIFFWRHRGFWQNLSHLARDGVHLDNPPLKHLKHGDPPSPMHKYWRSVRNAVIVHSCQLRPVLGFGYNNEKH
ncbi:uncharacterized protein LOC133182807 [Saccostrea echinata]|uniref:uncharacterized protein LOC133182807 n=1 Tax=Saccostrea echinata TaxID=191078 RepID=UPI002A7EE54B|nr:uncharacterized protein LOC133182807 [Saccostrea echinata]